jgi:hypothetical protein
VFYGIDIKYPEIQKGDRFNAAVRQTVDSLTESLKKEMSGVSAPDVPVEAT